MIDLLISLRWPLIILQVLISPILIGLILLQSGKGDDLGSALGAGGGSGNVAGSGGTSAVLVKGTAIFAVIFMINSVFLAKIYKELSVGSIGTSVSEPLVPATDSATGVDTPAPMETPAPETAPQNP